jgi:FkbH-like protein
LEIIAMSRVKKCVVWDLDNTLWDGVCLEGDVQLRPETINVISELDQRGILHSIASRGEEEVAKGQLQEFGIDHYFLKTKINWLPKHTNILAISRELNLALDSMAFIDDEPFELEQVASLLPEVMTVTAREAVDLPTLLAFIPSADTTEARRRRQYYVSEERRAEAAVAYPTREAFLKSCGMQLSIRPATEADVPRVLELMTRTHQLNTTGWLLSRGEILRMVRNNTEESNELSEGCSDKSPANQSEHRAYESMTSITVAELTDRFGAYGIIGVSGTQISPLSWTLNYLALSCRVLGRGIERAFLCALLKNADEHGFRCAEASFRSTGRNRQMRALYQMTGLRHARTLSDGETMVFRLKLDSVPVGPSWVTIV